MNTTNGTQILCIQSDPSNIISEAELPEGIVSQIVVEADRYIGEHPTLTKVFVVIEGWWEGFYILPTHDLSSDDFDYILLVATEAPKTQAAGVILSFLALK